MSVVTLPQLLEAGVHFGHKASRWNPKMRPYIFSERNGIHIIDLVQTAQYMNEAYSFMRDAADGGKRFLFVGTKRQAAGIVAQEARRCGSYFINQRWLGGMLTNWTTIKTRIEHLKELEEMESSGLMDRLPKQEASAKRRELVKLERNLGGIKMMRKLPDVVVIVDQRREYNAVQECIKLDIPIVSLLDTNCDPDLSNYFIPSNDDAIRAIKLIVGKLADAIYEGRHGQLDTLEDEEYDYESMTDYEDEYDEDLEFSEDSIELDSSDRYQVNLSSISRVASHIVSEDEALINQRVANLPNGQRAKNGYERQRSIDTTSNTGFNDTQVAPPIQKSNTAARTNRFVQGSHVETLLGGDMEEVLMEEVLSDLSRTGTPKHEIEIFRKNLLSYSPSDREEAVAWLGQQEHGSAIVLLKQIILNDPSEKIRLSALRVLKQIGADSVPIQSAHLGHQFETSCTVHDLHSTLVRLAFHSFSSEDLERSLRSAILNDPILDQKLGYFLSSEGRDLLAAVGPPDFVPMLTLCLELYLEKRP